MEINTRDFGIIQAEEDAIYDFPQGIYGFEEDTKFVVFEKSYEDVSFLYLQSVCHQHPCFLVFNPQDFYSGFWPDLEKEDLEFFEVETSEDLVCLVIATIPASIHELSLNLKSPILLNPKNKRAKQVILQNPDYSIRYKPFLEDRKEGAKC